MALQPLNFSTPQRAPDPIEQAFSMALAAYARNLIEEPFQKRAERRKRVYDLEDRTAAEAFARSQEQGRQQFTRDLMPLQQRMEVETGSMNRMRVLQDQAAVGEVIPLDQPVREALARGRAVGVEALPTPITIPGSPGQFVDAKAYAALQAELAPASAQDLNLGQVTADIANPLLPSRGARMTVPPLSTMSPAVRLPAGTAGIAAPITIPSQSIALTRHEAAGFMKEQPARLGLLSTLLEQQARYMQLNLQRTRDMRDTFQELTRTDIEYFRTLEIEQPDGTRRPLTRDEMVAARNGVQAQTSLASDRGMPQQTRVLLQKWADDAVRITPLLRPASGVITPADMTAFKASATQAAGADAMMNIIGAVEMEMGPGPDNLGPKLIRRPDGSIIVEEAERYAKIRGNPTLQEAVYFTHNLGDAVAYQRNVTNGGFEPAPAARGYIQRAFFKREQALAAAEGRAVNERAWRIAGALDPMELRVLDGELPRPGVAAAAAPPAAARVGAGAPADAQRPAAQTVTAQGGGAVPAARGVVGRTAPLAAYRGRFPQHYQRYYAYLDNSQTPAATYDSLEANIRTRNDPNDVQGAIADFEARGVSPAALAMLKSNQLSLNEKKALIRQMRNDLITSLQMARDQLMENRARANR
jgi:hypothetical protein